MNIKIVDCTIRDGGHINKWKFEDRLVKASYFAASRAGTDYFEIGYKNDEIVKDLGPFGYCREDYIFSLFRSFTKCKLLCMIDVGKYTGYQIPECLPEKTPFSGIRVASYPHEAEQAIKLAEKIYDLGYEVFINMMASSEWSEDHFSIIERWKNKDILSAIYFADSFGSYIPQDISNFITKLRNAGFKSIGFHSHNNLQMAFANTLQAISDGASFVDASIFGMGRGSGNLPIEIIISYLQKQGQKQYNVVPYLEVIERYFEKLFEEYKWGYSLESLLGGIQNVHPYYVAEMFRMKDYTIEEIWNALEHVKEKCPISFSSGQLQQTLRERFYVPSHDQATEVIKEIENEIKIFPSEDSFELTSLSFENRHKNERFLIIANGPSIVQYEQKIKEFIQKNRLITIGCNYLQNIYAPNYHIFVSKKRFLKYVSTISEESILLIPTFFGKRIVSENYTRNYEFIEIKSTNDSNVPPITGIDQKIVYLNVAVAAILTAYQMGAKEILVVGMDGYEKEDSKEIIYFYNEDDKPNDKFVASLRYEKLVKELSRVVEFLNSNGIPFSIVTPTTHKRYYNNLIE